MNPHKPTSGEQLIENYFTDLGIKFEPQKQISDLKNDTKGYRVADFYLPRLEVYVEYNGMYFSGDVYKKEYDIKTQVYIKNNRPIVVIYPNEIGVLDYAFHSKLVGLFRLDKFKNPKKFNRYIINRYLKMGKGYYFFNFLLWFILALIFFATNTGLDSYLNNIIAFICTALFSHYIVQFCINLSDYFYHKR